MTLELSDATEKRVRAMFVASVQESVRDLLTQECGRNLPFCEQATPASAERIRFAVLKMSEGQIERLLDAVALAQTDWRDVLVAAGFADDPEAHIQWWPHDSSNNSNPNEIVHPNSAE